MSVSARRVSSAESLPSAANALIPGRGGSTAAPRLLALLGLATCITLGPGSAEAGPRTSPHGTSATGKQDQASDDSTGPDQSAQHRIGPRPASATPELKDGKRRIIARRHFQRGKSHFLRRQYTRAIKSFLQAYEYWDHPSVLYNLASAYALMKDPMRSRVYLQLYLRHTRRDPARLPRVLKKVMEETAILTVRISEAPAGVAVFVDGRRAGTRTTDLVLRPGKRVVEIRVGHQVVRQRAISLPPGGEKTWEIDRVEPPPRPAPPVSPRPDPPPKPSLQRLHWTWLAGVGGATFALMLAAVGTSVASMQIHDKFRKEPWNATLASRGRSMQTGTNVLWGLSACAIAATATLAFFTRWKRPETAKALQWDPLVGPGSIHVRLQW